MVSGSLGTAPAVFPGLTPLVLGFGYLRDQAWPLLPASRSCIIFMPLKEDDSCPALMTCCLKGAVVSSGQAVLRGSWCAQRDVCPPWQGHKGSCRASGKGMTCQQQVTPGPVCPWQLMGTGSPGNGGFSPTCRKSPFGTH